MILITPVAGKLSEFAIVILVAEDVIPELRVENNLALVETNVPELWLAAVVELVPLIQLSNVLLDFPKYWIISSSIIIRPSFTLGGSGGGIANNEEEFSTIIKRGLNLSPTNEILLEESLLGWKEFEMEVVRDKNDNAIIVCLLKI